MGIYIYCVTFHNSVWPVTAWRDTLSSAATSKPCRHAHNKTEELPGGFSNRAMPWQTKELNTNSVFLQGAAPAALRCDACRWQ
jgi:hypothetical protein